MTMGFKQTTEARLSRLEAMDRVLKQQVSFGMRVVRHSGSAVDISSLSQQIAPVLLYGYFMKIVINYRTGNVTGNIAIYNNQDEFVIPKPGETVVTDLGITGVARKVAGPFRHSNRVSYTVEL
jgi:hypothetical protein